MATSSKFCLYFIVSLLILGLMVTNVVEGKRQRQRCYRDIDCVAYCARLHQGLALCNYKNGYCICFPPPALDHHPSYIIS
ncbi:hypothetical protein LINGRAHAP2_LOCUS33821, partial [Linum grandiflorum]